MAVFNQVSKQYIRDNYTHYALAYGVYPVYIGNIESDTAAIEVRNWFPEWGLKLLDYIVQSIVSITGNENLFMFKITGEIKK